MKTMIEMMRIIKVGDRVERHQPGDYSDGRRGNVVDINGDRIRVSWDLLPGGITMRPIRTWVNIRRLVKVGH
jgi:Tfp pilus assembly protein PilP